MAIIHSYIYNSGGISDFLRSVFAYYIFCKKNNIEYYLKIDDHPFKFCFKEQYIPNECLNNVKYFIDLNSSKTQKTENFLQYIKNNKTENFYVISNVFDFILLSDFITFKKEFINFLNIEDIVCDTVNNLLLSNNLENTKYNSIHIRLGDKYMKNGQVNTDERININNIYNEIDDGINFLNNINPNIPIILFSDNLDVKKNITNKYNNIITLDTNIHHTASKTNNDLIGTIETLSEFIIIGMSNNIYSVSRSGFSFFSAFLYDIPFYKKHNNNIMCFKDEELFKKYFYDCDANSILSNFGIYEIL